MAELSPSLTKIINLTLYQIGWFSCVLGAAEGRPISGALLALLLVGFHLVLTADWRHELKLLGSAALIGSLIDSSQQALGILTFQTDPAWPLWLPLWVPIIWAQFATLLRFALSWLADRYLLAAVFGALGGPLAYYAGSQLGAAKMHAQLAYSLSCLALVWLIITPALFWLSRQFGPGSGRYRWFR